MNLELTTDDFTSNMYTQLTNTGCLLTFNIVEECCVFSDYKCELDNINIEVSLELASGTTLKQRCTCVIGMEDEFIGISSEYEEYQGKVLNSSNLPYCTLIISDTAILEE